ncbi:MAG: TonB-dependent receptor, partial [Acidobacteriota bacterium]
EVVGDWRFARGWLGRIAYSYVEGTDEDLDQPLASIAPSQLVASLRYAVPGGRWGAELIGTFTESKTSSDLPDGSTQFQVPSSSVVDLVGWLTITDPLRLQLSVWNLTDEDYWTWSYARGLSEGSATLDRFTQPGTSVGAQLRYSF